MLVPALLTRMSIRPSSRPTRSIMEATPALSVTSVATAIAFTPRLRRSSTAAADLASLRPTTAISAPASASPRAMPRPMPPLPPVTIATLPERSKSFVVIGWCSSFPVMPGLDPGIHAFLPYQLKQGVDGRDEPGHDDNSTLALPDQDQSDGREKGAVFRPLQAADHEARRRPGDRAGALADPQQADRKREKA